MLDSFFETEDAELDQASFFSNASWDTPYPIPAHWHYHIEALYIMQGHVAVLLNGERFLLKQGELVQFNPRDIHAIYKVDDEPFQYHVLRLPVSLFFVTAQETLMAKYVIPFTTKLPPHEQKLSQEMAGQLGVPQYIRLLEEEHNKAEPLYIQAIGNYACLIYRAVIRQWSGKGLLQLTSNPSQNWKTVNEIENLEPCFIYLAEHFRESISVDILAKKCHVSYSYFAKLFKRLTGVPVSEYITSLRIEEAERMILGEESSVTQAALATGFNDISHFIASFKRRKGQTPKQYKKMSIHEVE